MRSLIGGITGPLGFLISILVFFRDRPRIEVSVAWGMKAMPPNSGYPDDIVSVSVINLGRRPAYVSHVSARTDGSTVVWLLSDSVPGKVLPEGSAPFQNICNEDFFTKADVPWGWKIRFSVSTSAGKLIFSPWLEIAPG